MHRNGVTTWRRFSSCDLQQSTRWAGWLRGIANDDGDSDIKATAHSTTHSHQQSVKTGLFEFIVWIWKFIGDFVLGKRNQCAGSDDDLMWWVKINKLLAVMVYGWGWMRQGRGRETTRVQLIADITKYFTENVFDLISPAAGGYERALFHRRTMVRAPFIGPDLNITIWRKTRQSFSADRNALETIVGIPFVKCRL